MSRLSVLRSRFFWQIYSTFSLLFLVVIALVSWIAYAKVRATVNGIVIDDLRARAEFLVPEAGSILRGQGRPTWAEALADLARSTGTRITVIQADGRVLSDSETNSRDMENHWDRPEVKQAIQSVVGISQRLSSTLGRPMLYLARAIRGADDKLLGVVRVSLSVERIQQDLQRLQLTMALIAAGGAVVALVLGWRLAQRVAVPIRDMVRVAEAMREGRYELKVKTQTMDELGRLGDTLNQLGTELTNKISELHRLETVRRDFVANVSHEIKTPLTSIRGYVETLQAGAIDDPSNRDRFLEKIERNATRLAALVQDLLSLAKIEAVEDSFKPQPAAWQPIITSVISHYEDAINKKGLRVEVKVPASPVLVMGDKEAMTQILDNLLTNAIKYTPEGGTIRMILTTPADHGLLEVADTGIGIPPEYLDRIFERFYRVDKARSRDMGGTGLGLSIVKHLMTAMGGEVSVESTVGVGSCFKVRLALAPDNPGEHS